LIHLQPTQRQHTQLTAKLFRGFSDTTRLMILQILRTGPQTVGEIVAATGLSQPNVSNHLGCLRDCSLVTTQQRGKYVVYSLSDDRVGQLICLAEELLTDVAHGVYACTRYNIEGESGNGSATS
jgi:ArsR family transcriptional regulator, cadmium/lead-responsive transcriptional repressor